MSAIAGYLTVKEAASRLNVSEASVQGYIAGYGLSTLPAVRIGNNWLIKEEDLQQFERQPKGNPQRLWRAGT